MFKIFSHTLRRSGQAQRFLAPEIRDPGTAVVGWGHKPTAEKARRYAAARGLPYIALEDGFYRSLDLACRGAEALSLVADRTGIYYDCTGPSDLETLLASEGWQSPELLEEARRAMAFVRRHLLSKYNHAPALEEDLWPGTGAPHVLLLDQTAGDASVALGGAGPESFAAMLRAALAAHPADHLLVKTHPDVLAGAKKGYLTDLARAAGVRVLARDCAPLSLLAQAHEVYTVTSQMGFEALIAGCRVHCYGLPFYAGWGLTDDALDCPRRTARRSLEEVFAAACLLYARYASPFTGELTDMRDILELLAEQRRQNERARGIHVCQGFPWWRRPYARAYLRSTGGRIFFARGEEAAVRRAKACGGRVVAWSSAAGDGLQAACEAAGVPLVRMEDGFIRSSGLGSDFNMPYSLVVDRQGIYYDPDRPSDLQDILNGLPDHPDREALLARARALRAFILEHRLTKYNPRAGDGLPAFPPDRPVILVPGQVEDDASVRRGGFGMGNLALLEAVRAARPDAFLLYKPHPDVASGNRRGAVPAARARELADMVLGAVPMGLLLERVDEVHTLTSQTGFEALLRGRRVVTYGGPFYAGWGLTEDHRDFPARRARLCLDELVAGTLILYPVYYDWQTRLYCRVEDVCRRLLQPDGQIPLRLWARLLQALRRLIRRTGQ